MGWNPSVHNAKTDTNTQYDYSSRQLQRLANWGVLGVPLALLAMTAGAGLVGIPAYRWGGIALVLLAVLIGASVLWSRVELRSYDDRHASKSNLK